MSSLDRAIQIAVQAHAGQKRRNGTPYILHPLRVMMRVETKQAGVTAMTVAVLHDVVEDTAVTIAELQAEGFSDEVLAALQLLTHQDGVPYEDYVAAVAPHPIARIVKLADLEDNMNVRELPRFTERDQARMARYHKAWTMLTAS